MTYQALAAIYLMLCTINGDRPARLPETSPTTHFVTSCHKIEGEPV